MATKKFDKELYDKANPLSNGLMSAWLERNGYNSIDPEETYGVDITCKKDDTPAFFETEIKYSWVKRWPNEWQEVRIPYRKHKIIDKWVRDADVKPINNKYMSNEKFYHIDVNDASLINMESLDITDDFINSKYPE